MWKPQDSSITTTEFIECEALRRRVSRGGSGPHETEAGPHEIEAVLDEYLKASSAPA